MAGERSSGTFMPHRNGWGYLSRYPLLGWFYVAWQKIWHLAGANHMHVNGLANKFAEADDGVIASTRTCLMPLFPDKPCLAMPVFSSGQSIKQTPGTCEAPRSTDSIVTAGGGIMAHPDGPAAGGAATRDAWDAAVAGIPLVAYSARASRARTCLGPGGMTEARLLPGGPLVAFTATISRDHRPL